MSTPGRLIAGAMSGTSADGIDVAIVRIGGRGLGMSAKLLQHSHRPYSPRLKANVLSVRDTGTSSLAHLAQLAEDISLAYSDAFAAAASAAGIASTEIDAIAAHGQTLYHHPPLTMQWLDPSLLAARTGCAVVSDFRRADCAAGGQGAPLVPFADYILFRDPTISRVLLNIGGIANLTFLPAGGTIDGLLAFDTGPGNCISDDLMRRHASEGPGVDIDGVRALAGKPASGVIRQIEADAYFRRPPPKSTDGPAMIGLFNQTIGAGSIDDALATACKLTARTIAAAIDQFLPHRPSEVVASGGGVHNAALMRFLAEELKGTPLRTIESLGVAPEAKEAVAFALLGAATLDGEPSNVPAATGASRRVVLGSITPRP